MLKQPFFYVCVHARPRTIFYSKNACHMPHLCVSIPLNCQEPPLSPWTKQPINVPLMDWSIMIQNLEIFKSYEGDNLQNSSSSFQLGNNLIRLILTTKCKQIIIAWTICAPDLSWPTSKTNMLSSMKIYICWQRTVWLIFENQKLFQYNNNSF